MATAKGPFEVTTEAKPPHLDQGGNKLSHNTVRKQYSGDMAGKAEAQMLAAYTSTPRSAGYVAIEHFVGSIAGKKGAFVLQHSGIMAESQAKLSVTIVPDSGTGELEGISGTMEIDNSDGKHSYILNYELGS